VKRSLVEAAHPSLSIRHQCELLGLNRSSLYYEPAQESEENLLLMRLIDEQYTETPFYGSRRMREVLERKGYSVCRDRIRRLMRKMGIEAIYPKPRTSVSNAQHKVYPYLLRDLEITRPNEVWASDITYVPMNRGFMYLVAIVDWYSRFVLAWQLSNTLEVDFCLEALREALNHYGTPEIFNTDQGSQYTSIVFTDCLKQAGIKISMDGKGRCYDNIVVERMWRNVKYEDIYIKNYSSVVALHQGMDEYFLRYNQRRPHQSLQYQTPAEVYFSKSNSLPQLREKN
jgi:putative transposase